MMAASALSSDGTTRYAVLLGDAPSCTCPGFTSHGYCYHLDSALARFGTTGARPDSVIVPDSEPEPPTPAASAVCDWCSKPCDSWSCTCCRVEQGGCWCPGCRPDLYQEPDADYPDAA